MKKALLSLLFVVATVPFAAAESTHKKFGDCTCRFQGADFHEGQTICARISGKQVTMQCSSVLNNTSWKKLQEGCEINGLS